MLEARRCRVPAGLIGRTITSIRYLKQPESDKIFGAGVCDPGSAVVIILDHGADFLVASMDEEGNGAGAIITRYDLIS